MVKEVAPPKQQLEGERSMQAPQLFEDRLAVYRHCPSSPRGQLLIIHGLGEHMGRLSEVFELFCSLDLDVTGIDLPGHGLSKDPADISRGGNGCTTIWTRSASKRRRPPTRLGFPSLSTGIASEDIWLCCMV